MAAPLHRQTELGCVWCGVVLCGVVFFFLFLFFFFFFKYIFIFLLLFPSFKQKKAQVDRVAAAKEAALDKVRPVVNGVKNRFETSERTGLRVVTAATLIVATHLVLPRRKPSFLGLVLRGDNPLT